MLKKLTSALLCLCLLAGLGAIFVSAEISDRVLDESWNDLKLSVLLDITVDGANAYYNCDYYPDNDNYLTDDIEGFAFVNWRGVAISPDGKYAFAGFLNGGSINPGGSSSATYMIKLADGGETVDTYAREDRNGDYYYQKGLAVDDRGYLYVGLAFAQNYNIVNLDIVEVDYENQKMKAVNEEPIEVCSMGTPGDSDGTKMGVNGVHVVKVGNNYFLYVAVNYEVDRLYKYDVTDPKNPTLVSTFGSNGYLDFQDSAATVTTDKGNNVTVKEANYMDCTADGTVYLAAELNGGDLSYGLVKISPDGQMLNTIEMESAYAVAVYEEYAVITAKKPGNTGYCATVMNVEEGTKLATIAAPDECNQFVYATIQNNILYLVDQGTVSESEAVDAYLYAVGLTTKAAEEVVKMRTPTQDPSEITTDDGANETTDDVTKENDVTTVSDTKADTTDKVDCSDAVTTSATTKSDSTTTATSSSKSGCGSIVAASAIFVPVLMAGMMLRKKKDK